jgi:hypothetical protein
MMIHPATPDKAIPINIPGRVDLGIIIQPRMIRILSTGRASGYQPSGVQRPGVRRMRP